MADCVQTLSILDFMVDRYYSPDDPTIFREEYTYDPDSELILLACHADGAAHSLNWLAVIDRQYVEASPFQTGPSLMSIPGSAIVVP